MFPEYTFRMSVSFMNETYMGEKKPGLTPRSQLDTQKRWKIRDLDPT